MSMSCALTAEKEAEIVFGKDQAVENLNNFKGSKHYEDRYRKSLLRKQRGRR